MARPKAENRDPLRRLPAALIPLNYVEAVERAGGRPVLIPPSEDGVAETIAALDGIVFSGGADVDPSHYGADAHPETDDPQAHRDAGELALLRAALEHDLPTLAVCRGFQLLNVARGGDLVQPLPAEVGTDVHKQVPGAFAVHPVEVKDGIIKGPGVYDMKGGLAAMMCALVDVARQDRVRVVFMCVPDEESEDVERRSTDTLVAASGGGAISLSHPAQRLSREATFFLIQAQTGDLRRATLHRIVADR